jgi:hypothetical protein
MILNAYISAISEGHIYMAFLAFIVIAAGVLLFAYRRGKSLLLVAIICAGCGGGLAVQLARNWGKIESFCLDRWAVGPDGGDLTQYDIAFDETGLLLTRDWVEVSIDDGVPESRTVELRSKWLQGSVGTPLKPIHPAYNWWLVSVDHAKTTVTIGRYRYTTLVFVRTWPLILPSFAPLAYWYFTRQARLRARRLRNNLCVKCGYSLAGHTIGQRCPECGTSVLRADERAA